MKQPSSQDMTLKVDSEELLSEVILNTGQLLIEFAQSDQFSSVLETSFGTLDNTEAMGNLQELLLSGAFLEGIAIEVLPNATLQGALGAYAATTNTIYLSQGLLDSSPETATAVLLEEVGHAIDEFLNLRDSAGDEGAIFSALVQGETLTEKVLNGLQQEDDSTTLEIDGESILVEQATFTVSNPNDNGSGSLRQAILDANSNVGADTITFDDSLSGEIINLTSGELNITDALTIEGLGEEPLTIDAGGNSRVFNIDDGNFDNAIAVTIDELTITGGSAYGGGGIVNSEDLTLSNSTVSGNSAEGDGGGIVNSEDLTLSNSTVSGNSAFALGGGISNNNLYRYRGSLTLTGSTVSGNSAGIGGGISNYGTATLSNSTVSGNSAFDGGGISNDKLYEGSLTLTGSTVSGNSAEDYGGGIINFGTATLSNSLVTGNTTNSGNESNEIYNYYYNFYNDNYLGTVGGTVNTYYGNNLFGDNSQSNAEAFDNFTPGTYDLTATSDGTTPTALENILEVDGNGNPLLQDNGGATETIALAPNSPAIDAGDNINTPFDQRGEGFDRVSNGQVDIGAFELQQGGDSDNEAPVANNDAVSTDEETVLNGNVLADNGNGADTDPDGDALTVTAVNGDQGNVGQAVTLGSGASVTLNADGTFSYDPTVSQQLQNLNDGETATETFTYTITDGNGGTDTATVEITINGVTSDSFPVIPSDQTFTIEEDSAIDTAIGTVEATTPDNSELTFSLDENNLPTDVDGDGTLPFAINDQGQLTVADSDDLNVESPESFTFNVIVTNEQELTDTEAVTVNLETTGQEPSPITTLDDLVFGTPNNDSLNAADQDNPYTGDNQITFTGAGEDTVDGTDAVGNNRIYASFDNDLILTAPGDRVFTNSGDDEILAASDNLIFAGAGNDRVDGSFGNGNNRLYGQGGDDDLFAGENDVLFAGEGNDRVLIAQGGDNLLTGGAGDDQFWVATSQQLPNSPNTITDFVSGEDVIGIGGFLELTFSDLTLTADNSNTIISFGADTPLAELQGVAPNSLTEADFAIVAQAPV